MENLRLILCLAFGFGVVLESILLVGFDAEELGTGLLASAAGSVIALIIGLVRAPELGLYTHVFIGLVIFIGVFSIIFRKRILPLVNERTLLVLNLIGWYAFFSYEPVFPQKLKIFICLVLILMSLGVGTMVLVDYVVGPALALFFYVWFLIMIVFLGLVQFPLWQLSPFFDQLRAARLGFADAFLSGMAFSFIATHAVYVLALIPIPYDRYRSFKSRWREVKVHAKTLIEKYAPDQLRPWEASMILLILGGLLTANLFLKLIPEHLAINVLIVIVLQIISRRFGAAPKKRRERS